MTGALQQKRRYYGWGSVDRATMLAMRKQGLHVTSRVRCAARFAALTGCTIDQAARVFELKAGGVWNAWERIYPDRLHPRRLRRHVRITTEAV